MSYSEALQWQRYISKYGPLNTGFNLERGFALIAMMISKAVGGKGEMEDFMPHFKKEASPQDVMQLLSKSRKN